MLRKTSSLPQVVFALSLLCVSTVAPRSFEGGQHGSAAVPTRAPKIRATTILEDLLKRKKERPRTSPRALAAYGNALLRSKGYDYSFDACDILKANGVDVESNKPPTGKLVTYKYKLEQLSGRALTFGILSRDDEGGGMCGECFFEIPALRVTKTEMVVLADGGWRRLRRPKEFALDEAALVDESLRLTLRTWQMPFQTIPSGVSADGSKLYVEFHTDRGPEGLLLELSDDGTLKFRARRDVPLSEGEWVKNFPKDPKNDYLSYVRFKTGGKTYVIKFTGPCT